MCVPMMSASCWMRPLVNWEPRSECISSGYPNRAKISLVKVDATSCAVARGRANASIHFVNVSFTVRTTVLPRLVFFRGPTKSIDNRWKGKPETTVRYVCLWGLFSPPFAWHARHCLTTVSIRLLPDGRKTCRWRRCAVARTPLWAASSWAATTKARSRCEGATGIP
jgi:hypothetical protein